MEKAAESGRAKARARLKTRPATVEQLRALRVLLAVRPGETKQERKAG